MMCVLLIGVVTVSTVLLTGVLRKYALRSGLIDNPNERSSHSIPTPRGGGLAIVASSLAAMSALFFLKVLPLAQLMAVGGGGLAVAAVGFVDDRHTLSPRVRLIVHLLAAIWALAWLDGLPPLQVGHQLVDLGWSGYLLGTLAIVWALNLFNFMDGIDGVAASEAAFITGAAALLSVAPTAADVLASSIVCAACIGFLIWNWPPAKIFMGDVGSGYIGYVIAVLALIATRRNPVFLWVWLILGGTFFIDATVTLIRRMLRGERVQDAHRSHAYQWLASRWRSHLAVTLSVLALNLLWLFPAAWIVTTHQSLALWVLAVSYAPLVVVALVAGAGRSGATGSNNSQRV